MVFILFFKKKLKIVCFLKLSWLLFSKLKYFMFLNFEAIALSAKKINLFVAVFLKIKCKNSICFFKNI